MRATALSIAKGSRRQGRCGRCGDTVTWATLAKRGAKNIPLVAAPVVLRTETGDNDVGVEILAFDQIHKCTAKWTPRPVASSARTAPPPAPSVRSGDGVYASFTSERIAKLKQQLDQPRAPKSPQQGRLC
jgi:hypothetical protein